MTVQNPALKAQRACTDAATHTPFPGGDWSIPESEAWRNKMAETHDQAQCPTCGYWCIWTERPGYEEGDVAPWRLALYRQGIGDMGPGPGYPTSRANDRGLVSSGASEENKAPSAQTAAASRAQEAPDA